MLKFFNDKNLGEKTMLDYTNSATIFLSQSEGNDLNNGFSPKNVGLSIGPVKTIKRVIDILQEMRGDGYLQPMTVKIMGDYFVDSTIMPGFAGNHEHYSDDFKMENVTFESYGDTRSRLIGGKKLEGFKKDNFNGTDCISLYIPEVEKGEWHFSDLYVSGKRAELTRFPKEGTLRAITSEYPAPSDFTYGSKWFIANKEDLLGIDVENTIVSFYHYWIDEHSPVESYDSESGKITMSLRSRFEITTDYERDSSSHINYYLENVSRTFGEKNEWYLDVKKGTLYYVPENFDKIDELEIFAPTVSKIAEIKGNAASPISGIRFRNLDFLCTKGDYMSTSRLAAGPESPEGEGFAADAQSVYDAHGAISFEHAKNCRIENCSFSCLGVHGIEIKKGCTAVRIENCEISEMGGGGVKIFGRTVDEDPALETNHCSVRNCTIKNIGKRYAAACGILVCHSSYNELSDNEICYTDYSGISVGWIWGYTLSNTFGNHIKNNHIHHIGMGKLSDMGGIYLLGKQSGTILEGNLIHDVNSSNYGGWGIYTDEGSSYVTIEKNTVWGCKCHCYHHHYGAHNTVRDNTFSNGGLGILAISRTESHAGLILEGNDIITDGSAVFSTNPKGEACVVSNPSSLKSNRNKFSDKSGSEPAITAEKCGDDIRPIYLDEWKKISGNDTESIIVKTDIVLDKIIQKTTKNRSKET